MLKQPKGLAPAAERDGAPKLRVIIQSKYSKTLNEALTVCLRHHVGARKELWVAAYLVVSYFIYIDEDFFCSV
jgi:hypothetical protein